MSARWDSLCRQCGGCCYEKSHTRRGLVVDYGRPCRHLDQQSRLCRIYDVRFRACPECRRMTIFHAWFSPYLPESCGYVRAFRKWRRSSSPPPPR